MHQYRATCAWRGSTGDGYTEYRRAHAAEAPPAVTPMALSADPAFLGDPALLNPEQLLVLAATSCQLLSFLAVAARARLDVIRYEDDAVGVMPEDDPPLRITRIALRPRITVRAGGRYAGRADALVERVHHLCEVAHRECYIANSLTTDIVIEPTIDIVDP
ncbi:MAG: OsmC family protein [Acidimicrobiia bacterium]|jgi:organic hydroperoxide reductase OsmC/OhrA